MGWMRNLLGFFATISHLAQIEQELREVRSNQVKMGVRMVGLEANMDGSQRDLELIEESLPSVMMALTWNLEARRNCYLN